MTSPAFLPVLPRREWLGLAGGLGFLIGVALLMGVVFQGMTLTGFDSQEHDGYIQLARSLAQGHGYRFAENGPLVMFRPPAYVALLVPIAMGPAAWQPVLVILLNCLLLWGAGCFMYVLVRAIFSPLAAKIAVVLLWVNWSVLWCLKNPTTWILQMFVIAGVMYWAWRAFRAKGSTGFGVVLGVFAGGAMLTHGVFCIAFAVMAAGTAAVIVWTRAWSKVFPFMAAGGMAAVIVLPWTWRNYEVSGRFVPVVEGAGQSYFLGNAVAGMAPLDPAITPIPHRFTYTDIGAALEMAGLDKSLAAGFKYGGFPGVDTERKLDEAMARDMHRNPLHLIPKAIFNTVQMFFPIVHFVWRAPVYQVPTPVSLRVLYDGFITLCNVVCWIGAGWGWGGLSSLAQRRGYLLLLGGIMAYVMVYMPLSSASIHAGYAFPAYVLLMPLTALGVERVVMRLRKNRARNEPEQ